MPAPGTCTCTPLSTDTGRLVYAEHLPDETVATTVGFWARARARFTAHGITTITRVVTDNGSAHRSTAFARAVSHTSRLERTRPFTPKHNGKVERYQRILAEEHSSTLRALPARLVKGQAPGS